MYIYLLLYQSLYDIINSIGHTLISVAVLTNGLGHNLISVLGFTYPLGQRLISALVLTSHLKCQIILLILLCLAVPFFNGPRLFLFSIQGYNNKQRALRLRSLLNQPLNSLLGGWYSIRTDRLLSDTLFVTVLLRTCPDIDRLPPNSM